MYSSVFKKLVLAIGPCASTLDRYVAALVAVAVLTLAPAAHAQPLALPQFVAGEHYQVLPTPVKLAADDKVEVMEVFWYGCSHCKSFEPMVHIWKQKLAEDVVFARTPAVWGRKGTPTHSIMQAHAQLYYVAEQLELPDAIHNDLFTLLVANRKLNDVETFTGIFEKYDVSGEQFAEKFDSFGIKSKVNQAEKRIGKNYLVQGTPEMVVNGRYRISARMAGSQQGMLDVVDFLIDLERKRLKQVLKDTPSPDQNPA